MNIRVRDRSYDILYLARSLGYLWEIVQDMIEAMCVVGLLGTEGAAGSLSLYLTDLGERIIDAGAQPTSTSQSW